MMVRHCAIVWLVTLSSAISLRADDSTKYDLKYNFKPGEIVRSEVIHKATVETTIQGNRQTAETRTTSVKAWKVQDVKSDGTTKFVHMVESTDMWHRMQGRQEMRYNSKTDTTPPQGFEDAAKRVGVPLSVITMDSRGKVVDRVEQIDKESKNPTPITVPMPEEPVSVGHEWTMPYAISVEGTNGGFKKIELRQRYVLKGVLTGVATIEVETQVLTPVHDASLEAQIIQHMTSGTLKFDVDAGRVISQVTDLDRRVIGFNGPASSMHYLTRLEENMLSDAPKTVVKPKTVINPAAVSKPAPAPKQPVAARNATKSQTAAKPKTAANAKQAAIAKPAASPQKTASQPRSSRKPK